MEVLDHVDKNGNPMEDEEGSQGGSDDDEDEYEESSEVQKHKGK